MWWSNKTINSLKCCNSMFHMFHYFCCNFNLPHSYHVAMFQGMRNSCCIHMLHYYHSQANQVWNKQNCECCICMFQWQWHDEIDDAYVYEMKCTFVEAKHLGCYTCEYGLRPSLMSVSWRLFLISGSDSCQLQRWLIARMSGVVPVMRIQCPRLT